MRPRQRLRFAIGVALALAVVAAIVSAQVWHGPTVLSLSASHGVDTGDLLALPFMIGGIALARRAVAFRSTESNSWSLAASTIALGTLLALAGVLASEGGPLVPAGGGTLDGTITKTVAREPLPVDRWTDLALTYDGSVERLYVNGEVASTHATQGAIESAFAKPLWIGGNHPYGEHFSGLIDEVRVYDRALSQREVRADMAKPVAPAPGLMAAYGFDAGSGRTATDVSGHGNVGSITGATWSRGYYGDALRFDGILGLVRASPSSSLNFRNGMTLSAWIRPTTPQDGWRTIIQHETDAYFLAASSGRENRVGFSDFVRIALVLVPAAWFAALIAGARVPRTAARASTWWLPLILFALGSLADAAFYPSGTLVGPALVALWLAWTASGRLEAAGLAIATVACAGLTVASIADIAGVGDELIRIHGATARSAALGALFLMSGLAALSSDKGRLMKSARTG